MGHIVQRLVRNAIMQAVNQVIQKKTQQEAAKFGNEWKHQIFNGHAAVIPGYQAMKTALPFISKFRSFLHSVRNRKRDCRRADLQYLVPCDRSGVPGYAQLWNENDACDHLLGQWYGIL